MNVARQPFGALLVLLLGAPVGASQKPEVAGQELTLPNGMKWLLFENHDSPTVAAGWTARVGSVDERPGITGISHFFEHMMFKGTRVIGTRDIDTDLRLIEEQEKVRDAMRAEMAVMRGELRRGGVDDLQNSDNKSPQDLEL